MIRKSTWLNIFFCLLGFACSVIFAQNQSLVSVCGSVGDAETGQPLSFTNIRILPTTRGTTTNTEGKYQILAPPGTYQLVFSFMGYRSDTVRVHLEATSVKLDVLLEPTVIPMQSVTVFSDEYNAAAKIILKAIARKKNALSDLHNTEFEAYTKSVFWLPRKRKTKPDTLIGGICEVKSIGYFKSPDKYKEVISARRQSANFSPAMNIFTIGKIPNLNDDIVVMERNLIVGPTAPNAFDYYTFEMLDTTAIDDIMVFRIKIIPRTELVPLFTGIISIADSSFSVMEVDVRGNAALDIPAIVNIHIQEKFSLFENRFWLPVEVHLNFEIQLMSSFMMYVEQISIIDNYRINQPPPDNIFDQFQLQVLPSADKIDSTAWSLQQRLPLTAQEIKGYQRLDSLIANANFLKKSIFFLIRSPFTLPTLPIITLADLFHFNRVEGAYLGLGLDSKEMLPLHHVTLKAGYGFSDKIGKYSFSAEQFFSADRNKALGFEIQKQIDSREPLPIYSQSAVTALCLLDKVDYYDYYLSKGWNIFSRWRPSHPWQIEIKYSNEHHSSIEKKSNFSLFNRSRKYRMNPPIQDGNLRSVQASLKFDNRQFLDLGLFEIPASNQANWLIQGLLEYSDKTHLKSEFDFTRCFLHVQRHQSTFATGFMDIDLTLGWASGSLPLQRLYDLPSSVSDFSAFGVFRTAGVKEFAGDKLAALLIEHNFGRLPLQVFSIPKLKNLKIDFILNAGAGWTQATGDDHTHLKNITPTDDVFYEVGLALGRILSYFRFDFSWRLTHHGQKNFLVTVGSSLQ